MKLRSILFAYLLLTCWTLACQVPVFRYALERWQADPYRLQIIHKEPLAPDIQKSIQALAGAKINLSIETKNLGKLTEAQRWSLTGLEAITNFPATILHAPDAMELPHPLLSGPLANHSLAAITQSPKREEISRRILAGDSAVWVLLRSGEREKDAAVRNILEQGLERARQTITLPEGVIKPEEVAAAEQKGDLDFEDVLRSTIPLKIAFSIIEIDPQDPAEHVFVRMLTAGMPPELYANEVVIAPIFGRGRCSGPMPGSELTAEQVVSTCEYLCGACACSVKAENPGFDVLMMADWDAHVETSPVIVEKSLPELSGVSELQQANEQASEETNPSPAPAHNITRIKLGHLVLLGGVIIGALFVLTVVILNRSNR